MTRASALRAILLAGSTLAPCGLAAQQPATPTVQSGAADAIRVLLDQATYWRAQFQEDRANEALTRVLALDPNNADALALQAQSAADKGDEALAQSSLAELKSIRPDDPRIAGIEQSIKVGPVDQAILSEARALARAQKSAEAVAAYRRAFKSDTPPAALATEYYQTLADTNEDWRVSRAGLAAVLRANPQDLRAQLAYAELLTYHDETRREGISRLGKLAQNPAIAEQASKDLRQSLLWLPVGLSSVPQYDIYLAQHPGDPEISRLEQVARTDSAELRVSGFDALGDDKIADAERLFSGALKTNPKDADSMFGLALVRLRQKRIPEARELLKQALATDPTKAEQYQPLLDGINKPVPGGFRTAGNVDYGAVAARRIRNQYVRVRTLTNRGEFVQAEALLRRLSGRRPSVANQNYLADIQARAGRLAEAEASYRAVLAKRPRNVQALGGLAGVLSREGKQDEAETLFAQAAKLPGGSSTGRGHAAALRLEAERMTDPVAQIGLFRAAMNADPADPWLRLELARALHAQHDDDGARAVMAPVASNPKAGPENLRAAIYFAAETRDDAQVEALVDRLPAKDKTAAMTGLARDARVRLDVREARALGNPAAERQRLLSLSSAPDPTGQRVAAFGKELIRINDKPDVREAVRLALASQAPTPEQRVAYGGVLLGAGYPDDARRITADLVPPTPVIRQQLTQVRDGIAVASSDKLNGAGNPAAAYDELAPRLAETPDSPDLNMALARLYASNHQASKAIELTQALLQQNPGSLYVRSSAFYAEFAAGDYGRARALARETAEQFPDEPQAWVDLGNAERARGHSGSALRAFRTAKTLREKQLSSEGEAHGEARGAIEAPVARADGVRYAEYIPANVANDASPEPLPEPVARQYAQFDPAALSPVAPKGALPVNSPLVASSYVPFSPVTPAPVYAEQRLSTPPGAAPAPQGSNGAFQMADSTQVLGAPSVGNPFHAGATPLPSVDQPTLPSAAGNEIVSHPLSTDPLTAQIDTNIDQLQQETAPRVEGALSLRGRSGNPGLERLFELSAPLEGSFSPDGDGRLKIVVTPTYLYSGKSGDAFNTGRFGTNPLGTTALPARGIRNQTAGGVALDIGYAYDIVTADIGASPPEFREPNVVGGIEVAPKLGDMLTLRLVAERRVVTDSLLSYAGTRDSRTGIEWGGVTRNRGHVQLEGMIGTGNYYVGAGGAYLMGHNVASNSEVDAGAGYSQPVWASANKEVRLGVDLVYFGFDKNLGGFSVGQGGYFSPQQFFAVLFPISFRHQVSPDLTYTLGGSVGWQSFRSNTSPTFPNNSALQASLVSLAATTPGLSTVVFGGHDSGIAGGARAEVDYRLTQNLHIGARAGFDRSGNFTEGTGLVYARYIFNDDL